jgi:UDP-N-acetylmuramoylalanine--D-glutamate ligase
MKQVTHFQGQRVTVVGLAREGAALVRFLVAAGAQVTISDARDEGRLAPFLATIVGLPVQLSLGGNRAEAFVGANWIFVSPGVPDDLPPLVDARERGVRISSATELFFQLCPAPIVGITGSSGKTTTTTLIGEMLKAQGERPIFVGGNIGRPLLDDLERITPDALVVMELSSFQLEPMQQSPHLAVLTNVTPNHLDRHGTMERYTAAKRQILRYQGPEDFAVLNADDPVSAASHGVGRGQAVFFSRRWSVEVGAQLEDGRFICKRPDGRAEHICLVAEARIPGEHNQENLLAAIAACGILGTPAPVMAQVVRTFPGVPHRLQLVAERQGVSYYNDSIATAPERTLAALRVFDAPLLLIAGGRDKHLPWDELAEQIVRRVRVLLLLGEAMPLIAAAVEQAQRRVPLADQRLALVERCATLEDAVALAADCAAPGDVVLLSPGCTSYDQFADFEERGLRFVAAVQALPNGAPGMRLEAEVRGA